MYQLFGWTQHSKECRLRADSANRSMRLIYPIKKSGVTQIGCCSLTRLNMPYAGNLLARVKVPLSSGYGSNMLGTMRKVRHFWVLKANNCFMVLSRSNSGLCWSKKILPTFPTAEAPASWWRTKMRSTDSILNGQNHQIRNSDHNELSFSWGKRSTCRFDSFDPVILALRFLFLHQAANHGKQYIQNLDPGDMKEKSNEQWPLSVWCYHEWFVTRIRIAFGNCCTCFSLSLSGPSKEWRHPPLSRFQRC